ncbi:MAG: alpha/beta fold hydrolase [Bryobacteraceae bacterium]|nr:alpha/beta fold hydrolase [Bryobacteraceae bacterium]
MERLSLPPDATRALVLTHGAGSHADAPLLVALSDELARHQWAVWRVNLAYRLARASGPPHPSGAAADRASLADAIAALAHETGLPVFAGGHSYGGRQGTMLAAEQPDLVRGLLILSYPLHPPKQPEKLRVEHLPKLRTPSLFVSGQRDDFGTPAELAQWLAPHPLVLLEGQGHSLAPKCAARIAEEWNQFSARLV